MCGIIGVLSRPPTRPTPRAENLLGGLDAAIESIPDVVAVAAATREVDIALRGLPGVLALTGQPELVAALTTRLDRLDRFRTEREAELDANAGELSADELEQANAALQEQQRGLDAALAAVDFVIQQPDELPLAANG